MIVGEHNMHQIALLAFVAIQFAACGCVLYEPAVKQEMESCAGRIMDAFKAGTSAADCKFIGVKCEKPFGLYCSTQSDLHFSDGGLKQIKMPSCAEVGAVKPTLRDRLMCPDFSSSVGMAKDAFANKLEDSVELKLEAVDLDKLADFVEKKASDLLTYTKRKCNRDFINPLIVTFASQAFQLSKDQMTLRMTECRITKQNREPIEKYETAEKICKDYGEEQKSVTQGNSALAVWKELFKRFSFGEQTFESAKKIKAALKEQFALLPK